MEEGAGPSLPEGDGEGIRVVGSGAGLDELGIPGAEPFRQSEGPSPMVKAILVIPYPPSHRLLLSVARRLS